MQFTFKKETIDKVNNNWLTRDNTQEFTQCKTDSDRCLTFVRVSNMTGNETGLGFDIASQVIKQITNK